MNKTKNKLLTLIMIAMLISVVYLSRVNFPTDVKAETYFEWDFEAGTFNDMVNTTSGSGVVAIESANPLNGAYSGKLTYNGGYAQATYTTGSKYNDGWAQVTFKINSTPVTDARWRLFSLRDSAAVTTRYLKLNWWNNAGELTWELDGTSDGGIPQTATNTTLAMSTSDVYVVDLHRVAASGTGGSFSLYVNGSLTASITGIDTDTDGQSDQVWIGCTIVGTESVYSGIFDDVYFGDTQKPFIEEEEEDIVPPTFGTIITNQTAGNYTTHFNVTVADDIGLATTGGYIFGTNNTGTPTNDTWVAFTTNPQTISVTKTINGTFNNVIAWQYWFNDTGNNWNTTGLQYSRVGYLATDGTPTNVEAAINTVMSMGYGDVIVPVGNWAWNTPVVISGVTDTVGFNLIGSIENETKLWETYESNITMLTIQTNQQPYTNPTKPIRISNLWFRGHVDLHTNDDQYGGGIMLRRLTDFRVDHCKFENFPNFGIMIDASSGGTGRPQNRGVIDHCSFDNPYKTEIYGDWFAALWGYGIIVAGPGYSVVDITTSGASNAFGNYGGHEHCIYPPTQSDYGGGITYIENNYFNRCRHSIAGGMLTGAYYVARYNYFDNARWYGHMDIHGGCFGLEAYNNTVNAGWDPNNNQWNTQAPAFQIRGGSALIYNNTVINTNNVVSLANEAAPYINDVYIWSNTLINCVRLIGNVNPETIIENIHYFLYAKPGYVAYLHPHPLTNGGTLQPAWDRINRNSTIAGGKCKVSASWKNINNTQNNVFTDINTALQYGWLESNETGTASNSSAVAFTDNDQWMNFTITLPSGGTVAWRQYANNSAGQVAVFSYQYIQVEGPAPDWHYFGFAFKDLDDNNVKSVITWKLWNSTQELTYIEGQPTLLAGTFTLKTKYKSVLINSTDFDTATYGNTTVTAYLQMKNSTLRTIGFNNTLTSLIINEDIATKLNFTATGTGVFKIVMPSTTNATYVSKDGVNQTYGTVWTYDSGNQAIIIESTLSTWVVTFPTEAPPTPPPPPPPSVTPPSVGTEPFYTVTIRVTYAGSPIQGALVTLGTSQATTDAQGSAVFLAGAGTYPLTVSVDGEIRYTSELTVTHDATYSIDLSQPTQPPKEGEPLPTPPSPWQVLADYWLLITVAIGLAAIVAVALWRRKH